MRLPCACAFPDVKDEGWGNCVKVAARTMMASMGDEDGELWCSGAKDNDDNENLFKDLQDFRL